MTRVALVHDWLNQRGGAEDVLEVMKAHWADAPVYTSLYDPDAMPDAYRRWNIRTTWMDHLPLIYRQHQAYLPLYPLAWRSLDLSAYDVLISNKSGFCHGVHHDPATLHVCYCLTPTRYVWQFGSYVQGEGLSSALAQALRPLVGALRVWDLAATRGVTAFVAISRAVQTRIRAYYRRPSEVIHPPVDTERFAPVARPDDYFLVVSRLIPYKRVDLAVKAATLLGLPLKVAGTGRALDALRDGAGPTVEFLGYVPDADLPDLVARCKAFIFPGLEDFGIAPVQAMAAGRPVIAFEGGGALDTVVPGQTGVLFPVQTVESLARTLSTFDAGAYDPARIAQHARRYDRQVFLRAFPSFVEQAYDAFRARRVFTWERPSTTEVA